MRVYLVQHGESKSEEEDPQRRLTDKGIGEPWVCRSGTSLFVRRFIKYYHKSNSA